MVKERNKHGNPRCFCVRYGGFNSARARAMYKNKLVYSLSKLITPRKKIFATILSTAEGMFGFGFPILKWALFLALFGYSELITVENQLSKLVVSCGRAKSALQRGNDKEILYGG